MQKDQLIFKTFESPEKMNLFVKEAHENSTAGKVSSSDTGDGFVSLLDEYYAIQEVLSNTQTMEEHNRILAENSDIIYVEDETYKPIIENLFYSKIINRDRIYAINGYAMKVLDNSKIVSTKIENIGKLYTINSPSEVQSSDLSIFVYSQPTEGKNNSSGKIEGNSYTCKSSEVEARYFYDPSGCKNDRAVFLVGKTYVIPYGAGLYAPGVYYYVYGRTRNWACIWSSYKTRLSYKDVILKTEFRTNSGGLVFEGIFDTPLSGSTSVDAYKLEFINGSISSYTYFSSGLERNQSHLFKSTSGAANSRGTGTYWAALNCSF